MAPPHGQVLIDDEDYKNLLRWLDESIRSKEMEDIKFLLDIADGEAEQITTSIKVFEYMEMQGGLSPNNVDLLEELLNEVERHDLVKHVVDYRKNREANQGEDRVQSSSSPVRLITPAELMSSPPNCRAVQHSEDNDVSRSAYEHELTPPPDYAAALKLSKKVKVPYEHDIDDIPHYQMSAVPRGFCLIISNENFEMARGKGTPLKDRPGTQMDHEMLVSTFKRLKFDVKSFTDQRAEDMYKNLNYYAMNVDHTTYDCFVCCILTHGNDSGLYGVDGFDLKIQNITLLYEPVTSLKGKPKLFFFQACRGVVGTRPYAKDDFGDDDTNSFMRQYASSPLGSDFFIGYATPPGYAAWIGKNGSWYISALCEALNKYSERYDLQHISTQINSIVSRYSSHQGDKQIPNPTFTLRKILYFFPENIAH